MSDFNKVTVGCGDLENEKEKEKIERLIFASGRGNETWFLKSIYSFNKELNPISVHLFGDRIEHDTEYKRVFGPDIPGHGGVIKRDIVGKKTRSDIGTETLAYGFGTSDSIPDNLNIEVYNFSQQQIDEMAEAIHLYLSELGVIDSNIKYSTN